MFKIRTKYFFFVSLTLKYLRAVLKAIYLLYYPDFEAGGCGFDPDGGHVCINT